MQSPAYSAAIRRPRQQGGHALDLELCEPIPGPVFDTTRADIAPRGDMRRETKQGLQPRARRARLVGGHFIPVEAMPLAM